MTFKIGLAGSAAIGALALLAASAPAYAASTATDAYTASISEYKDVLTSSSLLAADQGQSASLKTFAREEIGSGDPLAVAEGSTETETPINVAANMASDTVEAGGLSIGRSVDPGNLVDPAVYSQPLGTGVQFPTAFWSIGYLSGTTGKDFDWTYKAVQDDALTSLIGYYSAYSVSGDDLALRAAAIGELPKVKARLDELRRL